MAKIFIGTSGFSYEHWRGSFYPKNIKQSDWLSYYSKHFDTVEINSSFYRTMQPSTYENWFKNTPKDFIFSIKGPRFITHIKRLIDIEELLKIFFDSIDSLSYKLKVILWQFPAGFKLNIEKLENFLIELNKNPRKIRHSFEFRNPSWFCEDVYFVLKKFKSALVLADSPTFPQKEIITARFVYIRLHGSGSLYASSYKDNELKNWGKKIKKLTRSGIDVYCYFNNDIRGFAVENGLALKKICQTQKSLG